MLGPSWVRLYIHLPHTSPPPPLQSNPHPPPPPQNPSSTSHPSSGMLVEFSDILQSVLAQLFSHIHKPELTTHKRHLENIA